MKFSYRYFRHSSMLVHFLLLSLHLHLYQKCLAFIYPDRTLLSLKKDWQNRNFAVKNKLLSYGRYPNKATTALSAVDFFDGSQIVDPVIVSDVFWTKLQSNLLSFIIGQFLAATVFAIFLSFVSAQFGSVVDSIKGILTPKPPTKSPLNVPADLSVDGLAKRSRDIDVVKLAKCLLIDLIGTSSEAIPIVGEFTDVLWAPIAATALRSLFGGGNNILFALEFAEEILPFTDIIPLATLCWVVDTFYEESELAKVLGLGVYHENKS